MEGRTSNFIANSEIKAIHFSLNTDKNVKDQAVVEITKKDTFRNGLPVDGGVCDSSMGTTEVSWKCGHCDQKKLQCKGHPGYLALKYPLIAPSFVPIVIQFARVICHECGAFILGNKRLPANTNKSSLLALYSIKTANKKKTSKDDKKQINVNMKCPECNALHPRVTLNPIAKANNNDTILQKTFFGSDGKETTTRLYNHELRKVFERVSDETVTILGKPLSSHPVNLISYNIAIPSNIVRPNRKTSSSSSSGNNGLTDYIMYLTDYNNSLPDIIPENIDPKLADKYSAISQVYYNFHMNSIDANANKKNRSGISNINGIKGLFSKKDGIFRKDLEGTRTFECARAPITPNSRLRLNEVGIPFFMCLELYMDILVGSHNYSDCMVWFKNGKTSYPGCIAIIKAYTKDFYSIESINDSMVLEYGDIIRRNYINGDKVLFGRQPSLWDLSFRCLTVVVEMTGYTLRFNPIICIFFNADFDGDECPAFFPSHEAVALEISSLCDVATTGTNHQDGSAICGMFQNSLWGVSKLTQSDTTMKDEMAMLCLSDIPEIIHIDPAKKTLSGRELVSHVIPKGINYKGKAFMYNPQYPIKYKDDEINVNIVDGELISGVLDLSTVGQKRHNTLFHIITNIYGPRTTNKIIHQMQLMSDTFIAHYGSTIHLGDLLISADTQKIIDLQTEATINQYKMLFDKKKMGNLVAPINMTKNQFFEQQSKEILNNGNPINTILGSLDTDNNNLFHMIFRCKKGSKQNMASIMGSVGQQTINGNRLSYNKWRGSSYYQYFSSDPASNGFIKSSLSKGLTCPEILANSEEVRDGLINRQLSTATTGHQNREGNKSMETLFLDMYHRVLRGNVFISQPLYGGHGIDIRNMIYTKLQVPFISDIELEKLFHAHPGDFNVSDNNNSKLKIILDGEFKRICEDRQLFRNNMLKLEPQYMNPTLVKHTVGVCFDIKNIINYVLNMNKTDVIETIDPVDAVEQIINFTDDAIPYVFTNIHQQNKKTRVPESHRHAVITSCMVIREYLCIKNILRMKITNDMLKIIIDKIYTRYKLSIAAPGLAVGIIASHSLHEMYTQFMLDAHLRAGIGGTDTSDKMRGIEIMVARDTSSMKNPKMLLYLKPELEHNKKRAQEIANHIEEFKFKIFIGADNDDLNSSYYGKYFGGEVFDNPTHELMQCSKKYFERMKKYMGVNIPSDLSSYVIKFDINVHQMILKNMDIQTMVNALKVYDDKIFVVHGTEMDKNPAIFCYIKSSAFKPNVTKIEYLKSIEKLIINTTVRGIENIKSARVKEFQKSIIMPDGSISHDTIYTIATLGTNFLGIMCISELDVTRCQTDSVHEMECVLGISAGSRKLITEIRGSFDGPSSVHTTIFVSEMVFTGSITGINKKGAGLRQNDVLPLASYTQPIQVLSNAAINGSVNYINCPSSALILGAEITSIGTSSAIVVINDENIEKTSIEDYL